jgi:hypothetical protein
MKAITLNITEQTLLLESIDTRIRSIEKLLYHFREDNDDRLIKIYEDDYSSLITLKKRLTDEV